MICLEHPYQASSMYIDIYLLIKHGDAVDNEFFKKNCSLFLIFEGMGEDREVRWQRFQLLEDADRGLSISEEALSTLIRG